MNGLQIAQISEQELDSFFSSTPASTPSADTLAVGKELDNNVTLPFNEVTEEEVNSLFENEQSKEETPVVEEVVKEEEKETEEVVEEATEAEEVENPEMGDVLSNTVGYLIQNGIWQDFEGREELEITPEVYADLALKQNQNAAYQIVDELINSTGEYGKAIINYIQGGGNPDEIVDLFKEQKEVESIDTSSDDGKQLKIETYYSEVLGWSKERVNRTVKRLLENDEITTEFEEIESLYDKHYQEKLQEKNQKIAENKRKEDERQKAFVNNIQTALQNNQEISERDKKIIASSILDFKHTLDNGQKVNDFYLKFAEMQQDPSKYIELVHFVMNPELYKKNIEVKEKSKSAKEAFTFIKGNASVSKTKNTQITPTKKIKEYKGTDFSFTR